MRYDEKDREYGGEDETGEGWESGLVIIGLVMTQWKGRLVKMDSFKFTGDAPCKLKHLFCRPFMLGSYDILSFNLQERKNQM